MFRTFILMGTRGDIMWVHVVGADGHVSSCLDGLFFSAFCVGLTVSVLICYSLSVSF
jgi:hypothetical protein